ncbi:MAG: DNA translocase FtsK [Pirellulales bacterium]|nr:DNA translocase FtsK [Pirellulales bacterium]
MASNSGRHEPSRQAGVVAFVLLAASAFLLVSLATFDAADAPRRLVYPPIAETGNLCGRAGAWTAALLYEGLGIGAWYFALSLGACGAVMIGGHAVNEPGVRMFGWLLSLVGGTALVDAALPGLAVGTVIGSGGYLGATVRGLLEPHCEIAGVYILTTGLVLGGLVLATDYFLFRTVAVTTRVTVRQAQRGAGQLSHVGKLLPTVRGSLARSTATTDLEQGPAEADEEEDEESSDLRITRGAANRDEAAEADTEGADTAEEAGDGEPDDESAATDSDKKPADALRVRPPRKSEREVLLAEIEANSRPLEAVEYEMPSLELLLEGTPMQFDEQEKDVRRKAKILERTFANFGFQVKVVEVETGPVIAQFEVELEAGLRLSKITSLADDLAIALRVPSVRIVAPIPGKNTVGIEVPNAERQLVRLREVIEESSGKAAKMRIPIFLGKDVSGKSMIVDLATLPHLLIAGRTGTGKSVCLNTIIMSILMTRRPDDVRMLLIDPKMVELSSYMRLPHLMHPVVTDMKKAEAILAWAVDKMEERYALLARAGVRHISVYNQLGEEELFDRLQPETDEDRQHIPTHLPYIVIVADEMADLMMTAAKEVEGHIIRLAQKSRAVGIHLVLATQKPTVDVITGLIKSNLPARISFQVASRTDSRVVLDEMGADKLLGNGDLLFLWPGTSTLLRGQGAYVSDDEISHVVDVVGTTEPQFVQELVALKPAAPDAKEGPNRHNDELYDSAVDIVIREGRGSVSLLQRSLGIGYGRAARLIDYMAEDGIVGQYNGSQAREVLVTLEQWQAMTSEEAADDRLSAASAAASTGLPKRALLPPPEPRVRSGAQASRKQPPFVVDDEEGEEEEGEADSFDEESEEDEFEEAPDADDESDEGEADEDYGEDDAEESDEDADEFDEADAEEIDEDEEDDADDPPAPRTRHRA